MVVFCLVNAPKRTRGLLSRYCLEVRAGLFVGRLDKRLRRELWDAIVEQASGRTSAVVAWTKPNAQGYAFRSFGADCRTPVRYDGLWLIENRPAD